MKRQGKNYSVLIIPERGSSTRHFQFSTDLVTKIVILIMVILVSTLLFIVLFSNRYTRLMTNSQEIEHLADEQTDYIKALQNQLSKQQQDIEEQQKKIKEQEVYQKVIDKKLEEIDNLEKEVKEKLEQSNLFSFNELQLEQSIKVINVGYTLQATVEDLEKRIITLQELSEQIDEFYNKEQHMPSVWPAEGVHTSGFGGRDNPFGGGNTEYHPAVDIANSYGTPIVATAKGVVITAGNVNGYGNTVMIDHENGFVSIYGHNSSLVVEVGQVVEKGQLIAKMGSTGRSTGNHVHFELRKNGTVVNPYDILD